MSVRERCLALIVAAIWGGNFVMMRWGLDHYPPLTFTTLRYVIAALPVLVLPRPLGWGKLALIALPLLVGQFGFLMLGLAQGVAPGLASVIMQSQVALTIALASVVLHEPATRPQLIGAAVAVTGLVVIATTIRGDIAPLGFMLTLTGALFWAVGNLFLRRVPTGTDSFALVAWMSLVSVPPIGLAAVLLEGPDAMAHAIAATNWAGAGTVLYQSVPVTLVSFWIWSGLLVKHRTAQVVPFALLVPVFGLVFTALAFGETHPLMRYAGMGLVFAGVAIAVLPIARIVRRGRGATPYIPE